MTVSVCVSMWVCECESVCDKNGCEMSVRRLCGCECVCVTKCEGLSVSASVGV